MGGKLTDTRTTINYSIVTIDSSDIDRQSVWIRMGMWRCLSELAYRLQVIELDINKSQLKVDMQSFALTTELYVWDNGVFECRNVSEPVGRLQSGADVHHTQRRFTATHCSLLDFLASFSLVHLFHTHTQITVLSKLSQYKSTSLQVCALLKIPRINKQSCVCVCVCVLIKWKRLVIS